MKPAKLDEIQRYLQIEQTTIDAFTRDFAVNPSYALRWADKTFEAAARIELLRRCEETLTRATVDMNGELNTIEKKNEMMVMKLWDMARMRYQPSSTSRCSNMIDTQEVAAANWVLEKVFRYDGEFAPTWE